MPSTRCRNLYPERKCHKLLFLSVLANRRIAADNAAYRNITFNHLFFVFNDTWIIRQVIHGLIDVELLEGTVSQAHVSSPRPSIRRWLIARPRQRASRSIPTAGSRTGGATQGGKLPPDTCIAVSSRILSYHHAFIFAGFPFVPVAGTSLARNSVRLLPTG